MLLTGAELLFKQFLPKHRLTIPEIAPLLGIKKDALWKRLREGKCDLKIRQDEHGTCYVTLTDLACYLYPDDMSFFPPDAPPPRTGRGRPRGSKNKPKAKAPVEGGAK